jgi:hypothetical protein
VLAHLAENRLFLATGNYGLSWLWRLGVLCLLAVIVSSLVYPLLKRRTQQPSRAPLPTTSLGVSRPQRDSFSVSWDIVFAGVLVVALAWALWRSRGFGFRAGLFPSTVGCPVLALAMVQFVLDLRGQRGRRSLVSVETARDS